MPRLIVERDWILEKPIESFIVESVKIDRHQAGLLVSLFRQGKESAYIARYRDDVHGGLAAADIRTAYESFRTGVELNSKVTSAMSRIVEKVVGAEEKQAVGNNLRQCKHARDLAEIEKEFASGSRKTKADIARELGMEQPAKAILNGECVDFQTLISEKVETVKEVEEHLKICLADMINREETVKEKAREMGELQVDCDLSVKTTFTKEAEKRMREKEIRKHCDRYLHYINNSHDALKVEDHQICALNRGSEEGLISWKVELKIDDAQKNHPYSEKEVHEAMQTFFNEALKYSISVFFVPKVERTVKRFLKERSINKAILVFERNVEELFKQQGIQSKYVIGLDPGYLSIKAAFLKPSGEVISMDEFGIRGSHFDRKGVSLLKEWSRQTEGADLVFAIGNGKNSFKTQKAVSKMIEFGDFPEEIDVCFCVVPEHGASKYSCTMAALEEFGEKIKPRLISAASIARRLIDPMSEYVKIEPQHLAKGQYQLSMNENTLKRKLVTAVRDRVSLNGIDLNKASKHLLEQICGMDEKIAAAIVKYRETNGPFKNRQELKKVEGVDDFVFQQCAGFLRIEEPPVKRARLSEDPEDPYDPLDGTTVHPDDYETAKKLLSRLGTSVKELKDGNQIPEDSLTPEEQNILELIVAKPSLKPPPEMMKKVETLARVFRGQKRRGYVVNRADFGIFVDIGAGKDGLLRSRDFSEDKIKDQELPSVGDVVDVIVEDVHYEDGCSIPDRIGLKLADSMNNNKEEFVDFWRTTRRRRNSFFDF